MRDYSWAYLGLFGVLVSLAVEWYRALSNLLLGHGKDGVDYGIVPRHSAMLYCAVLHSTAWVQYLVVSMNIEKYCLRLH